MKKITIGIPAYKAQDHICDLLSSIQIQTVRDEIKVIIANDVPNNNDYDFVLDRYPDLEIKILSTDVNGGPGKARQRALEACDTDWITFADADDIFINPLALEFLLNGIIDENVVEVQGPFCQEIDPNPNKIRLVPRNDITHPWVFGRLYNVHF